MKTQNEWMQILRENKGELCVTIVVPFSMHGKPVMENPVMVRNAIKEASKMLSEHPEIELKKDEMLLKKLHGLESGIDFHQLVQGIGMLVSNRVSRIYTFKNPVSSLINIGKNFNLRPFLQEEANQLPCILLMLTGNKMRLFSCIGKNMVEINEDPFPAHFKDNFEYQRPSAVSGEGSTLKGGEEKSLARQHRLTEFFGISVEPIKEYTKKSIPVIVAGVDEDISIIRKLLSGVSISGEIHGNYEYLPLNELGEKVYKVLKNNRLKKISNTIDNLNEAVGNQMGSEGVEGTWHDVCEGNARIVLIEEDKIIPAYVSEDGASIRLEADRRHTNYVHDATGELIAMAFEKDCEIMIVRKGNLDSCGGVAVLHRFKEVFALHE